MIIDMFIKKLNNKINLILIKDIETDYEIRIIFNKGANIECGIERGYIHLFEHIIILEDMMRYLGNSAYSAVGYTDLEHMQIKFLCQNSKQLLLLLNYINKITSQIDIPDRVIKKAQNIVVKEIDTKKNQNKDNKNKILFLSEGKLDLPIGERENIIYINKKRFIEFINNYLNCVEICLIIFSDLDNLKIFNWCKKIFAGKNTLKKTFIEPKLDSLKNQKLVLKNSQKANKKIYCFVVNCYKDIKNIILQQLLELILKNIMKEKRFTISHKAITKENMYLIITFENNKDIGYLARNFVSSKEIFEKEKNELKKQYIEKEKIGFNKWNILHEIYKSFLYNMPIIDKEKIPSVLNIIDNIFYEDLKIYSKNILKRNCKIIEYVRE